VNKTLSSLLLATIALGYAFEAGAQADTAEALTPWLDIPTTWLRSVENGVVAVVPDDVLPGRSLLLLVEPPKTSSDSSMAAD